MKLSSRVLLYIARVLPVGYWRLIRRAAKKDSSLWDYKIKLNFSDGCYIRADLRESVYTGIFRNGCIPHQRGFDNVINNITKGGDTVFDIGGNVGYTALYFSHLVGNDGLVVVAEPVPRSFDLLVRTIQEKGNVIPLQMAVGDHDGQVTINVPSMLDLASVVNGDGESIHVKCTTINRLANDYGVPDIVKIDVEGFESWVIRGMKGMERVPLVVYEALSEKAREDCRKELEEIGEYEFFGIDADGALVEYESDEGGSDYLAVPEWAMKRLNSIAMRGTN